MGLWRERSDEGGGDVFEQLVDRVPASALSNPAATLQYVDMELVWQRLGVGDDTAERLDNIQRTFEAAVGLRLFDGRHLLEVEEARAEVGFDITAVEQEIAVELALNENLRIARVAADRNGVLSALDADPLWSSHLETVQGDAGEYFDWSNGGDDNLPDGSRMTPMRPLGVAGQLAVESAGDGALVTRTEVPAVMESTLATAAGEEPSIAEDGLLSPAINLLGEGDGDVLQAVGMEGPIYFSRPPPFADDAEQNRVEQLVAAQPTIERYVSVLAVEVVDGDLDRRELLVVHRDEESAKANAPAIAEQFATGVSFETGRPLSESLATQSVEQEGVVVRVLLADHVKFGALVQALQRRDVLTVMD